LLLLLLLLLLVLFPSLVEVVLLTPPDGAPIFSSFCTGLNSSSKGSRGTA
jgi:preprotein translocase subunit SecG